MKSMMICKKSNDQNLTVKTELKKRNAFETPSNIDVLLFFSMNIPSARLLVNLLHV
jgi:hypothetical protein